MGGALGMGTTKEAIRGAQIEHQGREDLSKAASQW
jgi:hypothetical protein